MCELTGKMTSRELAEELLDKYNILIKDLSNKKKWIMSKCFVVFTHIKTKGKRNILKGKHIFITTTNKDRRNKMTEI